MEFPYCIELKIVSNYSRIKIFYLLKRIPKRTWTSNINYGHFSLNRRSPNFKHLDFYAATAIWQIAFRRKTRAHKEITPL